jgi:hypothetical protein
MTEAFEKSLKRCRTAHLWTGVLNILLTLVSAVMTFLAYVLVRWVPMLIDSDLYTDEQRALYRQNQDKFAYLEAVLWILAAIVVFSVVLTFLAFHMRWCLRKGRYYRYCQVASWLQSLNAPVGTPAGVMAIRLLASDEGKAHFGVGGKG